ncbi:hypothetical protein [Phytoactinopolyspora limicola]|uniref:hypothetical protein n=1 Tax=Phytoactinopolyspora limicola TaxID=2715536 RepID=UPI00140D865B|nr:hypothetical protein [Phytoactinopolyspora limicola]
MSTDRVASIADHLAESPVYVEPGALPAEHVQSITEMVEDSPVPIYVVYLPLRYDDEFNGSAGQLLTLVHDQLGADGVYVSIDSLDVLTARTHGVSSQYDAARVAHQEDTHVGKIERFVELVATGTGEQAYRELRDSRSSSSSESFTEGVAAAAGGVVVFAVVGAIIWAFAYRAKIRRDSRRVARAYSVPAHVLDAVRGARSEAVTEQARSTILALGEELERTDVPPGGSALTEYRAALDAYDAAGRTLDRQQNLADIVGALVLAETGEAHLRRTAGRDALRRRPRPRPCFFNPLHGAAQRDVRLPGSAAGSVGACGVCAEQVDSDVQPDTLQVTVGGQDVPYYESGLEPWASTGYGALRANLVERVLTGQ